MKNRQKAILLRMLGVLGLTFLGYLLIVVALGC
jgi:hypothetical protein